MRRTFTPDAAALGVEREVEPFAARVLAFTSAAEVCRVARRPGSSLQVRRRALMLRGRRAVAAAALIEREAAGDPAITEAQGRAAWIALDRYCVFAGTQPRAVREVETAAVHRATALWTTVLASIESCGLGD